MSDYSTTCPWSFLAEMVEGGSFPKELLDKLKEDIKNLKEEIDDALDTIDNSFIQATDQERFERFREDLLV